MSNIMLHILNQIKTAVDSDDVLAIVLFAESNLRKDELIKFQNLLKEYLNDSGLKSIEQKHIQQFMEFLTIDQF